MPAPAYVRPKNQAITSTARRPKPKRRFPAEVLSPQEVAALMDACGEKHTPTCLRNRTLIAALCRSGLRGCYTPPPTRLPSPADSNGADFSAMK